MRAGIFTTTIEKDLHLGADLRHFRLALPKDVEFDFKAGQFASFVLDIPGEAKTVKRPYSIASPPHWKGTLDFIWKRVEGGLVTNHLWDLKEGDELKIQAPLGIFTCHEPLPEEILFISTGTGIAPFRSIIHDLLNKKASVKLVNIFGNRYENEIAYKEEFEQLEKDNSNFKNIFTVSRPQTWTGEKDYVQEMLKKYYPSPKGRHIYICGLTKMINEVNQTALELGYQKDQIFFEKYD